MVINLRSVIAAPAVEPLSSMAQLIGHGVGAIGPFAVGAALGLSGSWTWSMSLVTAAAVVKLLAVKLLAGLVAGRSVTVESPRP